MPETDVPITWVHDSVPTTIVRDGVKLDKHRVLVNNRDAAFLYRPGESAPWLRLDDAVIRTLPDGFEITGRNADAALEVWTHKATAPTMGCGSCGG